MAQKKDIRRILWVDDEIDSFKPHILFLEKRGYEVKGSMSGDEAIELVGKENFDLVLLDEMMPGKDGLTTLEEIKELNPHLPVVMVTKSEEESLMDDAIGQKIDDYLVKPINPSQILIVIKRLLDSRKIISGSSMKRYITEINKFNDKLDGRIEPEDWYEAARILSSWDLELDVNADVGLAQTLEGTRKEWNNEFTKYIEKNYVGLKESISSSTQSMRLISFFCAITNKFALSILMVSLVQKQFHPVWNVSKILFRRAILLQFFLPATSPVPSRVFW